MTAQILVAEDDPDLRGTIQKFLELAGYQVLTASDGTQASKILGSKAVDLVITDIIMAEKDGLGLIKEIRTRYPGVRIIAISGGGQNASASYLAVASRLGADATFAKPLPFQALLKCVQDLLVKATP